MKTLKGKLSVMQLHRSLNILCEKVFELQYETLRCLSIAKKCICDMGQTSWCRGDCKAYFAYFVNVKNIFFICIPWEILPLSWNIIRWYNPETRDKELFGIIKFIFHFKLTIIMRFTSSRLILTRVLRNFPFAIVLRVMWNVWIQNIPWICASS